uniref:NoTrlc n=1 Tax=Phallusia mammillata TaxID=59560 RepID=A0A6F9DNA1_9ASCI|nr:NoTrlc [Phallusia mammillata]
MFLFSILQKKILNNNCISMTPTVLNAVENPPMTCEGNTQNWMDNAVGYSNTHASDPQQSQAVYKDLPYGICAGNNSSEPIVCKPPTTGNAGLATSTSLSAGYATFNDFRSLYSYSDTEAYIQEKPVSGNMGLPGHYQPEGYSNGSYGPGTEDCEGFSMLEHFAMSANQFPASGSNCQSRIRTNLRKRERNLNINKAFEDLRGKIPNLPADTKVSKIKVLRLAADYIRHLNQVLEEANDTQDSCNALAEVNDSMSSLSPQQDGESESRKRSADEFKVDPDIVTIKRRKIDWTRIQEEITRHTNSSKSKCQEKQRHPYPQHPAVYDNFTYPCSSTYLPQISSQPAPYMAQSQGFIFHPTPGCSNELNPPEVATHMANETSFSPASFSSWETD